MKIEFNGKFRELDKLVQDRNRPSAQSGGFGQVLGSVIPNTRQHAQSIETNDNSSSKLTASLVSSESGGEPMASLNIGPPALLKPELSSIGAAENSAANVKTQEGGVKAPSVVSVRRVSDPFAGMHRSARLDAVEGLVQEAGRKHGIDPVLGMAVVSSESDFNATAVSRDGHASKGLFQLLDSTGQGLHSESDHAAAYNPFNPSMNVDLGVSYLRKLHDIFSRGAQLPNNYKAIPAANSSSLEKLAVAAFNAGEGRVAWAQSRAAKAGFNPSFYDQVKAYLPESTREYVQRVMDRKAGFERG